VPTSIGQKKTEARPGEAGDSEEEGGWGVGEDRAAVSPDFAYVRSAVTRSPMKGVSLVKKNDALNAEESWCVKVRCTTKKS